MKKLIIPFYLMLLFPCCTGPVGQINTLSPAEKDQGWTLLFDGRGIDQWRNYLSDRVSGWVVEEGCLKALGRGTETTGDLITRQTFVDFELSVDWKISPGGNAWTGRSVPVETVGSSTWSGKTRPSRPFFLPGRNTS
jgi:hypothetical protein